VGARCSCGTAVPPPDDPTARFARCPACDSPVDLAGQADDGTRVFDANHPSDPLLGRLIGEGRYRIDSPLGQGGMGRVYLGTQVELDRRVAIKVLSENLLDDEAFRRRFEREAKTLAALDHPHIVSVIDVGVEEGTPFLVMPYVPGPGGRPTSLADLLAGRPLDGASAIGLVDQICAALEYAHGKGIVHRDLKPGNVLIDETGGARIADFGIARAAILEEQTLTVPGTVMGSLRYMSPEQKLDSSAVDARTDLYSLGVMLYEMVTGRVPEGRFELPSRVRVELDPRLDRIVDRALQSSAETRYQSAAEMRRDVTALTSAPGSPPTEVEAALPPTAVVGTEARPPRRRRGWLVGAVALASLAVLVGALALGTGDADPATETAPVGVRDPEEIARLVFRALREGDAGLLRPLLLTEDHPVLGRNSAESVARIVARDLDTVRGLVNKGYRGVPVPWDRAAFAGLARDEVFDSDGRRRLKLAFWVRSPSTSLLLTQVDLAETERGWVFKKEGPEGRFIEHPSRTSYRPPER
jgi:tRNA A-37 threonylcarbamoyl transferase component Bud32